jgi:hypothetical protein
LLGEGRAIHQRDGTGEEREERDGRRHPRENRADPGPSDFLSHVETSFASNGPHAGKRGMSPVCPG